MAERNTISEQCDLEEDQLLDKYTKALDYELEETTDKVDLDLHGKDEVHEDIGGCISVSDVLGDWKPGDGFMSDKNKYPVPPPPQKKKRDLKESETGRIVDYSLAQVIDNDKSELEENKKKKRKWPWNRRYGFGIWPFFPLPPKPPAPPPPGPGPHPPCPHHGPANAIHPTIQPAGGFAPSAPAAPAAPAAAVGEGAEGGNDYEAIIKKFYEATQIKLRFEEEDGYTIIVVQNDDWKNLQRLTVRLLGFKPYTEAEVISGLILSNPDIRNLVERNSKVTFEVEGI